MKYLRDERNWFFQEKYFKLKVNENSVWPAKLTHQYQVRRERKNKSFVYILKKKIGRRCFYA